MKSASGGLKIAVFASGAGSNLRAILHAIDDGTLSNAVVALVVSNNSNSGALQFATGRHIPTLHISKKQFSSEAEYTQALLNALESYGINFIVLAGYMKKLDCEIVAAYKNRIINIHPALLPAFGGEGMYGMNVHKAVVASGAKVSGATVHLVDDEYDHGLIVLQEQVEVLPSDTPETVSANVLRIEHRLYPKVINLFAQGNIRIANGQVIIEQ